MNLLIILFHLAWLIQMIFLISFAIKFQKLKYSDKGKQTTSGKQIFIVVCARNELRNLQQNFYYWVNQKSNQEYCQLIIVDDGSTDGSLEFLINKQENHPNFQLISLPNSAKKPGKKHALSIGIRAVSGKYVVLTDADCKPSSFEWASTMASALKIDNKKIILGYAPYYFESNCVNYFVQYETTLTAMLYAGFALWGLPYMGVGRNIAYSKDFFDECGGLSNLPAHLNSGDDDMFVNLYATAENTKVCFNKAAHCYSPAPTNFKTWLNQKKRHLSTSPNYKIIHKILLSLYALSHFLVVGTIFVLIITKSMNFTPFILYCFRFIILFKLFKNIFNNSRNFYIVILVSFIDSLHILYYLTISFYSFLSQQNTWK